MIGLKDEAWRDALEAFLGPRRYTILVEPQYYDIAGDVLNVLDEIAEKPDLIILDPPRDGIHPKALPKILDYGVERIVYISWKPTSLARDLSVFQERGYQVERCVCVDQFVHTVHVETVVLLSHKSPDSHIFEVI